ncbi:type II CAAX endopeptidase family protein [Staphylococcus debuckii]|uniref:Type II CAAX endopeptidase family protein n=1 Tax=Staphylococcus debuckii TaxID=2044912 RepID=A0ABU9EZU2_9STAP
MLNPSARNKDTKQPSKAANTIRTPYDTSKVMKRDFWLIPLYIILLNIVPFLLILPFWIYSNSTHVKIPKTTETFTLTLGTLIGEIILLLIFYLMHRKYLIPLAIKRFSQVKHHILLIVSAYIAMMLATAAYNGLMQLLPKAYQFTETQNQLVILKMFDNPWAWPVLFLDIVILTPFVEELIFRHLIIHELGKKIGYITGAVISALLFAFAHVTGAHSPFEYGTYLIMAIALVFVYMKSGRNLAASISLHMLINLLGFISIVFQYIT